MTVGPWRPISLHVYAERIRDMHVATTVNDALDIDVDATTNHDGLQPQSSSGVHPSRIHIALSIARNIEPRRAFHVRQIGVGTTVGQHCDRPTHRGPGHAR